MAQKGIIKNTTTADISASNFASIFNGLFGKSGILTAFNNLACTKLTDNSVQLDSGVYSLKGFLMEVEAGTVVNLAVDSGTAGQNRNDLVVAELVKNGGGTGVDTLSFKVVKGTSTSGTAVDPTLIQQDVNATGVTRQEALYRVKFTGISIVEIEKLAGVIGNTTTLKEDIESIESIVESGGDDVEGYYTKYTNGDIIFWGLIELTGTFNSGSNAVFEKAFPVECVGTVSVVVSAAMYDGSSAYSAYRANAYLSGITEGNFYGHTHVEYASKTQYYIGVLYQANGKWK